ncbi:hypothetical protein BDN71DRAFT_1509113 [Pleurotus eryngii]|uniref:Uncharacterized protein n=1 Tax=Pleurotus eryngii TaxID=5323 RepID=A0A9P6D4X0_PLEER|nr:hypothetical protein BDN71DRAFT_1509113 [Pleurotus eryngii]
MNIATEAHRARLARLTTYIASARALSSLSWKALKTEHILVEDVTADPSTNPAQLIVVGQVSHGLNYLGPISNFNPQFDNMAKAKLTFELELPLDLSFASNYFQVVASLRRLQRDIAKTSDTRNLLVDATTSSSMKFGAPLFHVKLDDYDEEGVPDGPIADDANDPDYFPMSTNWPVPINASQAFMAMGETHIFEPLNVFTSTSRCLDPSLFLRKLPEVIIIREGATSAGHHSKKKPICGIRRDEPSKGTNKVESEGAAHRQAGGTTEGSVSSRKRKFGEEDVGNAVETAPSLSDVITSLSIANDAPTVDNGDQEEVAKTLEEPTIVLNKTLSSRGKGKAKA